MESSGAVIMPPTMGAAMRCMTSQPVPIGNDGSPAMINAALNDFRLRPAYAKLFPHCHG